MKYLDVRNETESNAQIFTSLEENEKRITAELQTIQEENKDLSQTIQSDLDLVFPENESHTNLTRTLEQFANDIHRIKNPFIINSLHYLETNKVEDANYSALPFKMTIHSSYANFFKFLEFVENSGTLSDQTRLLDINSITINFVSPSGSIGNISGEDEINFNASLNAYFRAVIDKE